MRVLVTGGVRSGKSRHAEALLEGRENVDYLAPGPVPGPEDPEWAARVAAHQAARPEHWQTIESADVASMLRTGVPALVDCLGTWLTAQLDELRAWDRDGWEPELTTRLDALVAAVGAHDDVVLVTNEAGMGVVPAYASGRIFRDLLGLVNQRVAEVCDEVHLVVAGRVLVL